jgi:hypothetical protein
MPIRVDAVMVFIETQMIGTVTGADHAFPVIGIVMNNSAFGRIWEFGRSVHTLPPQKGLHILTI